MEALHYPTLNYKVILTKTLWYLYKNKHIDQWNRIENPETKPSFYNYLIFGKLNKNKQGGKDSPYSINDARITG